MGLIFKGDSTSCDSVYRLRLHSARQFYDSSIEAHHHFFNVDTGELTDIPLDAVTLDVAASLPAGTGRAAGCR